MKSKDMSLRRISSTAREYMTKFVEGINAADGYDPSNGELLHEQTYSDEYMTQFVERMHETEGYDPVYEAKDDPSNFQDLEYQRRFVEEMNEMQGYGRPATAVENSKTGDELMADKSLEGAYDGVHRK